MNNYYLVLFINEYNEEEIQRVLNIDRNIGFCSIIYRPEAKYEFQKLYDFLIKIDKKYPWKLHEIVVPDYPITECIDVVLDTNIRKNHTDHYIVFENYQLLDAKFIDDINEIYNQNKTIDAIINKEDNNNGFVVSFGNHMILNKNNQDTLINKLVDNDKKIHYI